MSVIEEAIHTKLTTDADISGLISGRVYPLKLPQKPTLPAVTYQRISGVRNYFMDGVATLAQPRFQVDSWAATYSAAKDLAGKVRAALSGLTETVDTIKIYGVFLDSDNDLYDDDLEVYRVQADYFIHHKEA